MIEKTVTTRHWAQCVDPSPLWQVKAASNETDTLLVDGVRMTIAQAGDFAEAIIIATTWLLDIQDGLGVAL